uniref:Uncharacterized protein n=1 Tax=Lotharella globosa TaxID=91324 RepID=A0A7S4DYB8_9EUKA
MRFTASVLALFCAASYTSAHALGGKVQTRARAFRPAFSRVNNARQSKSAVHADKPYDIVEDGLKGGVWSANQQRVFLSETQFKTATLDEEPNLLENVQNLKLLSAVEDSGLLSILEENGVTLSFIESLGLLTTAENLGLLSIVSKPETLTKLYGTGFVLALAAAASLALPDDNIAEAALKTTATLGSAGGAVGLTIAARLLATLQGQGFTKVGTDGGRDELRNLAVDKLQKKTMKKPAPVLANIERLKLLSQVEKAGILSKLEKSGISLSKIEKLKLLSTAEKTKLLSLLVDTETPGKLSAGALALAVAAAGVVAAVPDTDSSLVTAQALGATALAIPAVAAATGAGVIGNLQKPVKN